MNTVALWIGWFSMVAGAVIVMGLLGYLAVDGLWRLWRSVTGFFNIVDALDALREKQELERSSAVPSGVASGSTVGDGTRNKAKE